jgi:biopolymer transport protein ExbD
MRVPSFQREEGFGFNMTPMIDVVFLLIIFFLVSSHLASQEVQLELDLPSAASGQRPNAEAAARVTVNVLEDGEIQLGADTVGADELSRRLQYELARSGADLEVRIRADRTAVYRHVEPILLACARAGAWNVTFAVTRKTQKSE